MCVDTLELTLFGFKTHFKYIKTNIELRCALVYMFDSNRMVDRKQARIERPDWNSLQQLFNVLDKFQFVINKFQCDSTSYCVAVGYVQQLAKSLSKDRYQYDCNNIY